MAEYSTQHDHQEDGGKSSLTRDARGRSVTMIDPVILHLRRRFNVINEETLTAINDDLEPGSGRRLGLALYWVPGLLLIVATPIALVCFFGGLNVPQAMTKVFVSNPGMWIPIAVAVVIPLALARKERFKKVRRVMLKHCCCPHCGYLLQHLPVDTLDQATICPECASAWDLGAARWSSPDFGQDQQLSLPSSRTNSRLILGMLLTLGCLGLAAAVAFYLAHTLGNARGGGGAGATPTLNPIVIKTLIAFVAIGIFTTILGGTIACFRRRK